MLKEYLLIAPETSSVINLITEKGVMRVGKEQEGKFLPFLAAPSIAKAITVKGVTRAGSRKKI